MAAPPAGPVADFCAELNRLVRKCRVAQGDIARALGLKSTSSVSELLNGRRRTPPDWDTVRRIVELCAERNGTSPPPPGTNLDARWWRFRHAELERTAEAVDGQGRPRTAPTAPAPVPALETADCVDMSVEDAVGLLAADRREWSVALDTLMSPPGGERSQHRVLDYLLKGFPERVRAAHGVARAALIQAARVVLVAATVVRQYQSREEATRLIQDLADGAHAAHDAPLADFRESVTADAASRLNRTYVQLATPLAAACPEFALVAGLHESVEDHGPAGTGLVDLADLLSGFTGQGERPAPGSALLRGPIASLDSPGPRLPSLAEGYVTPRFRLAGRSRAARAGIASDKWWEEQRARDGIERFLAAHLLGLPALLAPLVVLGHPGAGKSLLTKLLTVRLPAVEFRPLRVELRHAPAEADVQTQLEHALSRATGRSVSWPDWSEEESGPVPVVLLDGFDELLQAGAQRIGSARQWNYLHEVKAFQEREARLGRPLIVIVTSRTVVADRADIPSNSTVVRLEPFDEPEIARWLTVWNATNSAYFDRQGLRPLTPEVVLPHRELASQPLLLLMLALYDAVDNTLHGSRDESISRTQLYDRLLNEFVRRQVEKDGPLPPAEAGTAVERELHRLSVIALSMFHRGAQAINGEDAARDLRALGASAPGEADDGSGLLFGRFFFVHEAQAVVTEERLRSYEFMHATFGEHLAARLIEGALRNLAESHAPWDDGELYALLSFAPLTDRAQLWQNLRDMLATWPRDLLRTHLVAALIDLFRAVAWDPEHRTPVAYVPVRQRRAYRDAAYELNLVLIVVLAADEVYASDLLGDDGDRAAGWRRYALGWQAQLSEQSWDALASTLTPERCWRPDPRYRDTLRTDLLITTRRTPLVHHELSWSRGMPPPQSVKPLPDRTADRLSDHHTANLIRRVSFVADEDTELLLHAAYPLLLQLPSGSSRSHIAQGGRLQSAAQSIVSLLTHDLHAPTALPGLYVECLNHAELMEREERGPYVEAVLRHLVHDAHALPDDALAFVLSDLHNTLVSGGAPLTPGMERPLLDCVRHALDRGSPALTEPLDSLRSALTRDDDPASTGSTALRDLLRMTRLSHSTRAWEWSGALHGEAAARYFDDLLAGLDLGEVATRHPLAVIGLLRLAAELGLEDWLAAHTADLLAALPAEAFGLLRPSDLPRLRAALPKGAYDDEFENVQWTWRGREQQSP
ncbi:NACHT domain-containing protein [Streptomyces sp. NPDC048751]|uniref:NACHT domain-containing protein n=1 Tax=Streptomyces sp. NPDC048751 TaxID=3365591 RepID=UPI003717366C